MSVFAISALANFSAAYNLAITGYVLLMLELAGIAPSERDTSQIASAGLIGAILGQVGFGYLGSRVGVTECLGLTLALVVFGNLVSVFTAWDKFLIPGLILGRFLNGVGSGGVYPLSAVATADASSSPDSLMTVFCFQGVAQLCAPLFVLFLDYLIPTLPNASWRILLLVGALPASFAIPMSLSLNKNKPHIALATSEEAEYAYTHTSLLVLLVGTAGSWFLFDFVFYGNVIFTPFMLKSVFSHDSESDDYYNTVQGKLELAKYSTIIYAFALVGLYLSVKNTSKLGNKRIQIMGFTVCAALFGLLYLFYGFFAQHPVFMFGLYLLTFFFYNFGPNATTFVLPSETFPREVKSTYNGISAACGKVGAVLGASSFKLILDTYHLKTTFLVCAVLCCVGVLVTMAFVRKLHSGEKENQDLLRELTESDGSMTSE